MSHQHRATAKKQKLTSTLELTLSAENQVVPAATNVADYLNRLHSLMIGYAKVGCEAVDPQPTLPESRTSDAADYIQCPLDIFEKYWYRAQDRASQIHPSKALEWIRQKDEDERKEWIDHMKNTKDSLGKIVKKLYIQREVFWSVPDDLKKADKIPPPPPAAAATTTTARMQRGW